MKSFAKDTGDNRWRIFVTDNEYETYSMDIILDKRPSNSEMEKMYKEHPERFIEA